jgi:pimeloyl-ACP methyl ester carboxylesterase
LKILNFDKRDSSRRFSVLILALLTAVSLFTPSHALVQKGKTVGKKVTFTTKDGVIISGLFQPAEYAGYTFILLHGLGSSQDEWQPFAAKLVRNGYGFFSYDARGHGQSILTKDKKSITYQAFGGPGQNSQWSKMVSDLAEAVQFLTKDMGLPQKKIGLIGASLGANVCIIYASTNNSIPMVALLSCGINYAGLDITNYINSFQNRPIAFVASPGDTYAYQSSLILYQNINSNKKAVFIQGSNNAHGVQMFDGKLENTLIKWFRTR